MGLLVLKMTKSKQKSGRVVAKAVGSDIKKIKP